MSLKTSNLLDVFSTKGFLLLILAPTKHFTSALLTSIAKITHLFLRFNDVQDFRLAVLSSAIRYLQFPHVRCFLANFWKAIFHQPFTLRLWFELKRHLRWLQNGTTFWCNEVKANWIRNCCCSFPFFNVTINNINTTNEWIALKLEWKITSCPCNCFCKIEFAIVACSFP